MSNNILNDKEFEPIDVILDKIKKSMDRKGNNYKPSNEIIELTDIVYDHQDSIADAIISDHDLNLISTYLKSFTKHLGGIKSQNYFMSEEEIREIFKDTLKPYLKSWLNNNIARMVKEILEQEIRKVLDRIK